MIEVTDTELEILKALWELDSATANEVVAHLNRSAEWHEKTVRTLLGRMVKKNALRTEKSGRAYVYIPNVKENDYVVSKSRSMLDKLFNGSLPSLVAGFAASGQLKKHEVDELKSFIAKWEKDND